MRYLLVGAGAAIVAACATTDDTGNSAAVSGQTPIIVEQSADIRPENNDIVCRIEAPTGTRMRERICRTQAEWEAIQEAGRETIRHRQSTGYIRN
tara:strand:+ start:162 stop:446 length:285 start_codon:yes stop_codon:yes gene_type:complete